MNNQYGLKDAVYDPSLRRSSSLKEQVELKIKSLEEQLKTENELLQLLNSDDKILRAMDLLMKRTSY